MCNYSSVKLELLALKWAVTEKLRDYLLGSQFQVYMDNNPLTYVMESKLGASQIWWLSELALFNFVIKYQTGQSNRATDALSCHPFNPTCDGSLTEGEADSEECEVISYSLVCEAVDLFLNSTKIPKDLKQEVQNISCVIMEEEDINENKIVSSLNAVSDFEHVTPKQMAEKQQKDPTLELVYQLVTAGEKPKTSAIAKIKSKAVRKYLLQFDRLTLFYINYTSTKGSNKISGTSSSTASWWPRSSGDWKNYCPMPGAILLEYHVPRCNQIC